MQQRAGGWVLPGGIIGKGFAGILACLQQGIPPARTGEEGGEGEEEGVKGGQREEE